MKLKDIAFIVNPNAKNGATGRKWPQIRAMAAERLGNFRSSFTARPGEASGLARQAINAEADAVICVGGDGTLNEVVNGLMGENGPIKHNVILGYIPCGTGCDFARSVSIPRDPDQALKIISNFKTRTIDLGRLSFRDHQGQTTRRYFINVLGFGIGGEVAARVNRSNKMFGGFLSFIWATLVTIFIYKKKRLSLQIDDTYREETMTWNVAVANGRYQGGGMLVAPDAALDDGRFHITLIGDLRLPEVFINLPKLYNGKILTVKKVRSFTGQRIKADSSEPVLLEMDGEQAGMLPVEIEIVPAALNFICP